MPEYNELPTAKSKNIGQIALEVVKSICGYLCRQGPNYLETCDPEGVKEDFGRICDARGQRGILGKSTLKGSHVYMKKGGYLFRQPPFFVKWKKDILPNPLFHVLIKRIPWPAWPTGNFLYFLSLK